MKERDNQVTHAITKKVNGAPAELHPGLGQGYAENPGVVQFYDTYRPGLAGFAQAALAYYVDHTLPRREIET